jgi:DNA invertase Pin-like site-specific DNA recombinase
MTKGKRAAIYTRKFHADSLKDLPLAAEVEQCKDYCLRQNYSVDDNQIYYEQATSELDSPKLKLLFEAAKNGLLDVVVITGPGKLSSSPSELVTILQQFKEVGVQIETTTPSFMDGLLSRPKTTEHIHAKKRRHKKHSKWTEYAINGDIASAADSRPTRAAIYAYPQQKQGSENPLDIQIIECRKHCKRYNYSINYELRESDEQNRPELNRLIEVARNGLIDVVVLVNIQGFHKRPSYLINTVQIFQDVGIQIDTID